MTAKENALRILRFDAHLAALHQAVETCGRYPLEPPA